jgi:hypothetical protein
MFVCVDEAKLNTYATTLGISQTEFLKKYLAIRETIMPKCKALYDLIAPKIVPFMGKVTELNTVRRQMEKTEQSLKNAERRMKAVVSKYERTIKFYEDTLKSEKERYAQMTGATHL